jgi:hypothetical protein
MDSNAAWEGASRAITIELHARTGEIAGVGSVTVSVPVRATASDVKRALASRVPALAGLLASSALATEHAYLAEGESIGEGAVFHLVPPVSGG